MRLCFGSRDFFPLLLETHVVSTANGRVFLQEADDCLVVDLVAREHDVARGSGFAFAADNSIVAVCLLDSFGVADGFFGLALVFVGFAGFWLGEIAFAGIALEAGGKDGDFHLVAEGVVD